MANLNNVSKSRRRTGIQILIKILKDLEHHKKARKTSLMYFSQLNSQNFERYFDYLLNNKYIIRDNDGYYVLTSDGINYIKNLADWFNEESGIRMYWSP